jgi:hypothetical protein
MVEVPPWFEGLYQGFFDLRSQKCIIFGRVRKLHDASRETALNCIKIGKDPFFDASVRP